MLYIFPDNYPIGIHFLILFPHSPHFTSAALRGFIFCNVTRQDRWRNSEQGVSSGPAKEIHNPAPKSKALPLFLPILCIPELSLSPSCFTVSDYNRHFRERIAKSRAAFTSRDQDKRFSIMGRRHFRAQEQVGCLKAQRGCCQVTRMRGRGNFGASPKLMNDIGSA